MSFGAISTLAGQVIPIQEDTLSHDDVGKFFQISLDRAEERDKPDTVSGLLATTVALNQTIFLETNSAVTPPSGIHSWKLVMNRYFLPASSAVHQPGSTHRNLPSTAAVTHRHQRLLQAKHNFRYTIFK